MIVKNEARLISQCLESAQRVAGQLVVVDTGSTDQTPQLALEAGAEVYHHPWRDSFSEARNHSLDYARGEWILILDGDEVLDPETTHLIEELDLSDRAPDAYLFEVRNFTTDRAVKEESGLISQVRLFRNSPAHRYGGLVHNQLHNTETHELLSGPVVPIQILHYGYTPTVWAAQKKDDRIALHERSVREHPESHFVRYNYANHLKILGDHREALNQFMLAIPSRDVTGVAIDQGGGAYEMSAELEWGLNACFLGAFCANQVGEHEVALALTEEALHRSPMLIDAHVRRAEALIALNRYSEASALLRRGLLIDYPHLVKGRALHYDAPYRLGRALFLGERAAEATPAFASLAPGCQDITVFTHLCLCAIALGVEPLWRFARARGAELDPHDPDWPVVDQHISRVSGLPLWSEHHVMWPTLVIEYERLNTVHQPDIQATSQAWREQLSAGLESLKPGLAAKLNVTTLNEALDASPHPEGELHLRLTLSREHARLSLYQSYEAQAPLYAFPERYALTDRARPSESAALLLSHLTILSAELSH